MWQRQTKAGKNILAAAMFEPPHPVKVLKGVNFQRSFHPLTTEWSPGSTEVLSRDLMKASYGPETDSHSSISLHSSNKESLVSKAEVTSSRWLRQ